MTFAKPNGMHVHRPRPRVVIVGAGIGGLAAAVRLAAAGTQVIVLDRQAHAGGKIRTLPSDAGPVDAGPTVLTMRHVFDDLFASAGARLDDHVRLFRQDILARHFWRDGSTLDLFADPEASAAAIRSFAGPRAEADFRAFNRRCAQLFDAFDAPMMRAAAPTPGALARHVMRHPTLLPKMAPLSTMAGMLRRQFRDPRLAQLFGRYATYVGGSPYRSPALLALIWQAEASGVWVVQGGMHKLAGALAELAAAHGAEFRLKTHVDHIELRDGRAHAVHLSGGQRLAADAILFNGDPRALASGALGSELCQVAPQTLRAPRSHSARVYSFAARVEGPALAHHNVFFADDMRSEFTDLAAGRIPRRPSLYLCAEDRGQAQPAPALERFEIIANAPAREGDGIDEQELQIWHETIIQRMEGFGARFSPTPSVRAITTPQILSHLFPGSQGAIYGQSPHGLMAAFARPTARTPVPGLYLTGGGAHPGAGVPMATLSARHAAVAILNDLTSESTLDRTDMHGGMSTV
ncbi:MAG: phytoene desaturase family protein [Rhodobacteraceae bacterium]|nr:phytoene desaturase family protein [Paracoccaceae bacterium]